ncbi:CPBP family intramembrane glutamic endopeptidase [Natronobiforma cellulositropha]|uniref:CPBP family intramembrane glutamic endopeptidase n=1 Tax=Natronobiforma cellulositropha TaxID=1679076 RepID=UPI0021D5F416|nr:CPBP family intramembrane glutamic endopeptidase [Natronobiforma cellulositropha]
MEAATESTEPPVDEPLWSLLVAVGLTVGGLLGAQLAVLPALALEPALADSAADASRGAFLAMFALNFVGMAAVGAFYLVRTGHGWDYLDLRLPTLRDWGYVVVGVLAVVALVVLVTLVSDALDVPTAQHSILEVVSADPPLALYLIVFVFLFNAPAEEFLFRNVIQKRLYATFSRYGAVVVASVVFALVHLPVYALGAPSTLAVAVSLAVMFVGSLVFGALYVRTENLVVPTLAHAGLNAVQFLNLYLVLEYAPEELDLAMFLPLW